MIFLIFTTIYGLGIAANYYAACLSRDQALKFTAFVLSADFGVSTCLHFYTSPPSRIVWHILLDAFIIIISAINKPLFNQRALFGTCLIVGYLMMICLSIQYLVTHGNSVALCEYGSDGIFLALLLWNMRAGLQRANSDMGRVNRNRSSRLRFGHSGTMGD